MGFTNYKKAQSRERLVQFIKLGDMEDFALFGYGVEDTSKDYEAKEEELQYVTQRTPFTETTAYKVSQGVSQKVYLDDPFFLVVDRLRREQAVGDKASGILIDLNYYLHEEDYPENVEADQTEISITFTNFGGPAGEVLGIEYTINYNSKPKLGMAAVDYGTMKVTFTETPAVEG